MNNPTPSVPWSTIIVWNDTKIVVKRVQLTREKVDRMVLGFRAKLHVSDDPRWQVAPGRLQFDWNLADSIKV